MSYGFEASLQQAYLIVLGPPSNTMLGEVTKIVDLECKVLWG